MNKLCGAFSAFSMNRVLAAGLALLLGVSPVFAVGNLWNGNVSTDWNNAGNWSAAGIPTSSSTVFLSTTSGNMPSVSTAGASSSTITIDGGSLTTLTVTGGQTLTNSSTLIVGSSLIGALAINSGGIFGSAGAGTIGNSSSSSGSVTISGSGSSGIFPTLTVGSSGQGALTVDSGGLLATANVSFGNTASALGGSATITGSGSLWTNSGQVAVGVRTVGSVEVLAGAVVANSSTFTMGSVSGGNGTVTVSGSGSKLNIENSLTVGGGGVGNLTISSGGIVTNVSVTLGNTTTGVGSVQVDSGGIWLSSSIVTLGQSGSGTLTILSGGLVTNFNSTVVGSSSGGTGSATVDGAGSVWSSSSGLSVGGGNGTLTVSSGGLVANMYTSVGVAANSVGSVQVESAGIWRSTNSITIGLSGSGTATISSGGSMNVGSAGAGTVFLGGNADGRGVLNIGSASASAAASAGIVNAGLITLGSGGGVLQINTTGTQGAPFYLTKDGSASGAGVNIGTGIQFVHTAGYSILPGNSTNTVGAAINGGTLQFGSGSSGSIVSSGTITNNSALIFAPGSASTVSGIISGSGTVVKTGSAALTLSGANTYTGTTAVNAGALTLDGSSAQTGSGALTVASGATLSGIGHIAGNATISGTLSPGSSPGTLTFDQNLTLASGSATAMELASAASFDKIAVTGTFTPGGTLTVTLLSGYQPVSGATFDLIDWGTFGGGTFSTVTLPALSTGLGWDASALYTTGTITVIPVPAVTAVSPSSGLTIGGTGVTLTGVNFTGATDVKFGSTSGTSIHVVSDTSITVTSPAGSAGAVDITVTTSNGTSATSSGDQFTYIADTTAPTVVSIVRKNGAAQTISSRTAVFTVTFSEPVKNVSANSFAVTAVGSSTIVGSVTSVSPSSGSSDVYDVTVSITSGTGQFRLTVL